MSFLAGKLPREGKAAVCRPPRTFPEWFRWRSGTRLASRSSPGLLLLGHQSLVTVFQACNWMSYLSSHCIIRLKVEKLEVLLVVFYIEKVIFVE